MNWVLIWLFFWVGALGVTNFLFKKHKVTYYENPWQHSVFYLAFSLLLIGVYQSQFSLYFDSLSLYHVLIVLLLFVGWLVVPAFYKNDYYSKKERLGYQVPKFFEVLFQDLCFLGGLLTFGVSPTMFGLVFFIVHIPAVFFLPKKLALLPVFSSLFGGLVFAHLQSQGIPGFLSVLFIHLLFWIVLHYVLSRSNRSLFGITPVKR